MFYVKAKISEGVTLNASINDENVYTRCPDCGCEHAADLVEIVKDGGDLYATAVRCPDCSKKHRDQEVGFKGTLEYYADVCEPLGQSQNG